MRQAQELLGVLEPRPVMATVSAWGPSSSDQFRGIWIFRGNKESGGGDVRTEGACDTSFGRRLSGSRWLRAERCLRMSSSWSYGSKSIRTFLESLFLP